jgi:hypothetical protein
MSLNNVFEFLKYRNSGLLKSGITAKTPNICRGFQFDYTQQFHTNDLLTTQFNTNLYVTFIPLTLEHLND